LLLAFMGDLLGYWTKRGYRYTIHVAARSIRRNRAIFDSVFDPIFDPS